MSDTVAGQEFTRVESSEIAPAVWKTDWLPDEEFFPELTGARETYLRLRAAWESAATRRRELESQMEADEAARKEALRDAYLQGEPDPQAQRPDADLVAELAAVKEQSEAAMRAYIEHINRCIALVLEHRHEWRGEISAFEAGLDGEIQALLAQAAALRTKRGGYGRLGHWIQRVQDGASLPVSHMAYGDIPLPPSGNKQEEEARTLELTLRSYAGGLAPGKPVSDEQRRAQEQSVLHPEQSAEDEDVVDLNKLEVGELVDWLMGCGMFDSQPKPSGAQVVAAAEDDPGMAFRLLDAERTAQQGGVPRADVLAGLTDITNRKALA